MTTYILLGGHDSAMTDSQNAALRDAISEKLNGKKPQIASVSFAMLREYWEIRFRDRRMPAFERLFGRNFDAKMAFPDTFREDCAWANVIYIHGGDDNLLEYYLDKFKDLRRIFSGKIILGTSAGADYLSKMFWTCDWRKVMSGRGLAEVAVITHFSGNYGYDDPRGLVDWKAAEKELRAATDVPVYLLREGEFEIFEDSK
jgi:hypothetical protein